MRQEMWQERAEILSEYSGTGRSIIDISKATGLSNSTVRKYGEAFGFDFGNPYQRSKETVNKVDALISEIKACAAQGKTRHETAAALGVSLPTVYGYCQKYGIEYPHALRGRGIDETRADAMGAMYQSGKTLAEIGALYGITRERVRQIISKEKGLAAGDGGSHVKAERGRTARQVAKDRIALEKYGCLYREYLDLVKVGKAMVAAGNSYYITPTGAWHSQKANATVRGIEWNLNLWDWWTIWQKSGKWSRRGRSKSSFVMCRFGDAGAYEPGNVYIATLSHNSSVQPNNPYRKDHPQHEEAMASVRRKLSLRPRSANRNRKYDLPLGVTMSNNRYQAQINIGGRNKYLGTFGTPEEAAAAYTAQSIQLGRQVVSA